MIKTKIKIHISEDNIEVISDDFNYYNTNNIQSCLSDVEKQNRLLSTINELIAVVEVNRGVIIDNRVEYLESQLAKVSMTKFQRDILSRINYNSFKAICGDNDVDNVAYALEILVEKELAVKYNSNGKINYHLTEIGRYIVDKIRKV